MSSISISKELSPTRLHHDTAHNITFCRINAVKIWKLIYVKVVSLTNDMYSMGVNTYDWNSTASEWTTWHSRCLNIWEVELHSRIVKILLYTGLFISPSETSELDCATTKKDRTERSISIGRESLKVFFVLGTLAYLQVPPLGGSRDEKWRAQWISVLCLGICQNWVNCDGATEVSDHVPHRTTYGQNNSWVVHEVPEESLPVRCETKRPAGAHPGYRAAGVGNPGGTYE